MIRHKSRGVQPLGGDVGITWHLYCINILFSLLPDAFLQAQNVPKSTATGALSQTLLKELTALPIAPSWILWKRPWRRKGEYKRGRMRELG